MGNADAAFNLGIYHHYGRLPVVSKNKVNQNLDMVTYLSLSDDGV